MDAQALEAQAIADGFATQAPATPARNGIRVWDLPLRIFHWALVLAVATAIVTAELSGDWMALHGKAGLSIIGLVVFRVVWGFIGSTHARFFEFAPTPSRLKAYWQGRWKGVGHNPLGALSVLAMLGLLALQAGTGLFSNDDIAFSGPLSAWVDEALASRLTGLHKQFSNVLFALLALHVVAIVVYVRIKKRQLIKPMLTGWKERPTDEGELARKGGGPVAFAVALVIAVAAVVAVSEVVHPPGQGVPSVRSLPSW
jgi:cytochrome b